MANVRSFSTPYSLPASDQTARLRVFSDGMVRAIPKSACIDFRLPGAGVLVAPRKGYADRNNESVDMPVIDAQPPGTVKSEFKIPAGEPVAFVYNRDGCYNRFTFVPKPGADYELNASGVQIVRCRPGNFRTGRSRANLCLWAKVKCVDSPTITSRRSGQVKVCGNSAP